MNNTRNYFLGTLLIAAVAYFVWSVPSSELAGQRSVTTSIGGLQ